MGRCVWFIGVGVGSVGCGYVSSCSFGFALVHSGAQRGLQVHSGSLRFTRALLWFVGFIRFGVDSLGCS